MFKTISVPSGIGDLSWMYSKLCHAEPVKWLVSDGWPARSVPYLKLLPKVGDADYARFHYDDIVTFEQAVGIGYHPTWRQLKEYPGDNLFLEANQHLEMGKPLKDWLPDLPTDYHYDIRIPQVEIDRAEELIRNFPRPIWGVSCASYRGAEAWKTWGAEAWIAFLERWVNFAGGTIVLLGANWDDLTSVVASEGGYQDLVGRTSVPMSLHLMRNFEGYIGFSCGLGIVRTVFNKPTFMLWPEHQVELSRSWADPEMLETGSYVASQWWEPERVFLIAKAWHKRNYT